jgi:hypothetical protein
MVSRHKMSFAEASKCCIAGAVCAHRAFTPKLAPRNFISAEATHSRLIARIHMDGRHIAPRRP